MTGFSDPQYTLRRRVSDLETRLAIAERERNDARSQLKETATALRHALSSDVPQEALKPFQTLIDFADKMPKETPAPGAAGTRHKFEIEAALIWGLARAVQEAKATLAHSSQGHS